MDLLSLCIYIICMKSVFPGVVLPAALESAIFEVAPFRVVDVSELWISRVFCIFGVLLCL